MMRGTARSDGASAPGRAGVLGFNTPGAAKRFRPAARHLPQGRNTASLQTNAAGRRRESASSGSPRDHFLPSPSGRARHMGTARAGAGRTATAAESAEVNRRAVPCASWRRRRRQASTAGHRQGRNGDYYFSTKSWTQTTPQRTRPPAAVTSPLVIECSVGCPKHRSTS